MTVPAPASPDENRFFWTAMFLLRRLPRDTANFLDVAANYRALPYHSGWNHVHHQGAPPNDYWMYLSNEGSSVSPNLPDFKLLGINPTDVPDIFWPDEQLAGTAVWKWLTSFSVRHSQGVWARETVRYIDWAEKNFDNPPSMVKVAAQLKLWHYESLILGKGGKDDAAFLEFVMRKYLAMEAVGEVTALLLAYWLGDLSQKAADRVDGIMRLRQEFVEAIDGIIGDSVGMPPLACGLMLHAASLYGFTAMKLSQLLQSDLTLPNDVRRRLIKSDGYVDERLVTDVQTPTIRAAAVGAHVGPSDMGRWDAPDIDVVALLQRRYWPHLSEI